MGNSEGPAIETDGARLALRSPWALVVLHGFIKKTSAAPDEALWFIAESPWTPGNSPSSPRAVLLNVLNSSGTQINVFGTKDA